MARKLAPGRLTKQDPGEAIRKVGFIGAFTNKGIFGDYLDQYFFEAAGYEHILGSISQVNSDFATITWDQAQQRFEDKSGSEVVLGDYERVAVIGMDTLTDNIVIDNVTGLEMFHIGGTPGQTGSNPKFQLGDNAGSGVPFKILLGSSAVDCKLDLLTDKPFDQLALLGLTQAEKQYIANQGKNNYVKVNGEEIYNPSEAGNIITKDTEPNNPYLLRMNGAVWPWQSNGAVDGLAWFRDLNIKLDGQRWDGISAFTENQSRFTLAATAAWLFQVNIANRFMTDISALDTRVHERTDPYLDFIAATADFVNTSNVVTFQGGIGNVKNGMRISGASVEGILDGAAGTTILRNIDTTAGTAEMFNALTGAAVNATSTTASVGVTIDNSGAAGGSHDEDAFQGHDRFIEAVQGTDGVFVSTTRGTGPIKNGGAFQASVTVSAPTMITGGYLTDGINGTPRTRDQTQPISQGIYHYYKA